MVRLLLTQTQALVKRWGQSTALNRALLLAVSLQYIADVGTQAFAQISRLYSQQPKHFFVNLQ